MRHGPAEDVAESTGRDADRVLTATGQKRVRHVADALLRAGEFPSRVLTSPLARAVETGEILVASAPLETTTLRQVRNELGMGASKVELVAELVRAGNSGAVLIGHEPDLSMLVASLCGSELTTGFATAMVVGLVWPDDAARAAVLPRATCAFVLNPTTFAFDYAPL
jgi:phosphohistidine phosphatase